jgi:phenylpropionate dioxygenase-like ring-hydroxylating dioxygenase large terminal subunit
MERAVGFDKADYGLPSLPVELWQGFVFTTFDPDPHPLTPTLWRLTGLLEHFAMEESVTVLGDTYNDLPWNWKVMLENFNDSYHANRLHGTKQDWAPSENCEFFDDWSVEENHVTRIHHANHIDGSFNPTTKVLLPVFARLTEEERRRALFALVPPSLGLAIVPDLVTYFVVCPQSAGRITIHIGYCVDPRAPKAPLFNELLEQAKAGVNYYNVEDIWVDTMCQRGLASRFGPKGRLSWQEETVRQLNAWVVERYRRHWPTRQVTDEGSPR